MYCRPNKPKVKECIQIYCAMNLNHDRFYLKKVVILFLNRCFHDKHNIGLTVGL